MTQPLDRAFNAAVLHIARRLLPCGFDVGANAPSTLEAITEYHAKTGRIKVWSGASDKTIFGQFASDQRAFDLNVLHRAGFYLDATT